jgi:hypothetical protein
MKHFLFTLIFTAIAFGSGIYGQNNKPESKCLYFYDGNATKLEWTAYKFTEKLGVSGTFDKVQVRGARRGEAPVSAVDKLQFSLQSKDINSNLPDRDEKIKKYFFGSSRGGAFLTGNVQSVTLDPGGKGRGEIQIRWNGKTKLIPVQVIQTGKNLQVTGSLDVGDFGMLSGINKLNEVCKDLHIGKDGVSKLWPTVDFKITSKFRSTCDKG